MNCTKLVFAAAAASAGMLLAWQSALAPLGVTEQKVREVALSKLLLNIRNPPRIQFFAAHPASKVFVTLSPEQRTAAAEALAAVVKSLLLSPETKSAWVAELAKQGGIDHGLKLTTPGASGMPTTDADINKMMDDSKKQLIQGRLREAQEFEKKKEQFTPEILTMFIEIELGMVAEPDSMMVVSPAAQKAAMAKFQEAKRLVASNPAAAQKALADGRFLAVGIKPDSAGLADAAQQVAKGENAAKQQREQETFNQYQFAPTLRAQLQNLIATAATVDFQAATQKKGTRTVFVNPSYESKSSDWKLLYRAGKGPVTVAVAAAKQVLAGLPK